MRKLLSILIVLAVITTAKSGSLVFANQSKMASWYSAASCKREGTSGIFTASGERFNEMDLTAAMWGVKFGTRVEVINISNGKRVIVRINDRGPSKRLVKNGRIIDLSKGAFMKIASLRQGVIEVTTRIISEDGSPDLDDGKGNYWYKSDDGRYYYDNKGHYLFNREEE